MQFYFHSIFHSYASPFSSLLIFLLCLDFWSALSTENMRNQSSKTDKILKVSPIFYCNSSPPQKTATLPKTVIHRFWLTHFKINFRCILLLAIKQSVKPRVAIMSPWWQTEAGKGNIHLLTMGEQAVPWRRKGRRPCSVAKYFYLRKYRGKA